MIRWGYGVAQLDTCPLRASHEPVAGGEDRPRHVDCKKLNSGVKRHDI